MVEEAVQMNFEMLSLLQKDSSEKFSLLNGIRSVVESCIRCQDLVQSRVLYPYGKPTFGFGNPNSPIFFIGEAPGMWGCGTTGIPFHGDRSGEYFQKILREELGMTHKDIWITNIVKCCPENNRTPTDQERVNCFPYLQKELEIVKPYLIVPMGQSAAKSVLGNFERFVMVNGVDLPTNESKLANIDFGHRTRILSIWHPAFVLRVPEMEEKYRGLFRRIQNTLLRVLQWDAKKLEVIN
jgi:uracil-DNA glycosylase